MSDLISRQAAIDALHMHLMYRMGTDSNKKRLDEWINNLPPAQPNPDRSCKTCYYIDEYLGGVFFCRRVKESKRVKPDFYCKKWRGEQKCYG